jgi:DNA-binding LytR/AlgR family response regulator
MNYYIVEDQKDARDLIQKYIEEDYPQLQCIGTGDRYANALEAIPKLQPDLLLLDINLGTHSAFELLDQLAMIDKSALGLIIFISAYDDSDRILKAFEYFPLRYITKPIDRKKLQLSIDQAIHQFNLFQSQHSAPVPIRPFQMQKLKIPKIKGEISLVDLEHILFMQTTMEAQLTKIYTTLNPTPITSNKNLAYFKEMLFSYKQFFIVSQSLIVNLNYLKSYNHHNKILELYEWSTPLNVSRRGGEELRRWLSGE